MIIILLLLLTDYHVIVSGYTQVEKKINLAQTMLPSAFFKIKLSIFFFTVIK